MKKLVLKSFDGLKRSKLISITGGELQLTTDTQNNADKLDTETPGGGYDWDDPNYKSYVNGVEVDYWNESR